MNCEPKKQYLVKDYMRTDFKTLSVNATIRETVKQMIVEKTNGLVVVDESKNVLGIVSGWDIIKYIVPDYLEEDKHLASFEAGSTFAKRTCELADKSIKECMTKCVHTINPADSLMEAITKLAEFHIRQLPVVDETGVLVGYLNRTDIKLVIGEILDIPTT